MTTLLLKYLSVYLFSMVRFVGGPLTGRAVGLGYLETVFLTVAGMMTTVFLFTLFGVPLRSLLTRTIWKNKKRFTKRNRQFVYVWKRWGIIGVSILTPLLFSPIGGALLANIFGGSKKKMLFFMGLSAFVWSFIISGIVYTAGDLAGF